MIVENPKAITSWSGFIYQGIVAVVVTLDKLTSDFNSFKNFTLKIEKLDDFSFHDEVDDCISLHQVKCKKAHLTSGYINAIRSLQSKRRSLGNIPAFLHTSVPITDYSEADVLLYEIDSLKHLPISTLESVQVKLIKKLIRSYLGKNNISENVLKVISHKMNFLVIQKVLDAHDENMTHSRALDIVDRKIKISDFIEILDNFNFDLEIENDQLIKIVKQQFSIIIQKFIVEDSITDPRLTHILNVSEKIVELKDEDFIKFLYILMPTHGIDITTNELNVFDLIPTGFDVPFLKFIIKAYLIGDFISSKCRYEANHENVVYSPYGMADSSEREPIAFAQRLASGMFKNKDIAEFYYQNDVIVTRETDIENIFDYVRMTSQGSFPTIGGGDSYFEPKKIDVISLRKAYEILGI